MEVDVEEELREKKCRLPLKGTGLEIVVAAVGRRSSEAPCLEELEPAVAASQYLSDFGSCAACRSVGPLHRQRHCQTLCCSCLAGRFFSVPFEEKVAAVAAEVAVAAPSSVVVLASSFELKVTPKIAQHSSLLWRTRSVLRW